MADFEPIGEIAVEAAEARVFEHGWQSWSPSSTYAARAAPPRPTAERNRVIGYRPGRVFHRIRRGRRDLLPPSGRVGSRLMTPGIRP